MRVNYTKIIATLGPSSDSSSIIENLVQAGLDVARMNFSHGTYPNFKQIANNVRKASRKHNRTVGIMQDLQGPKIRLGLLPKEGISIKRGQKIIFSTLAKPKKDHIPIKYRNLHKDVRKNHLIFVDDGLISTKIDRIKGNEIHCTAKTKGTLFSNKGINTPNSTIKAKTLTPKDIKDLNFGLKLGIDFVALSFVKDAKDIKELRSILTKKGHSQVKIISKIERHEAIDNLEEIVQESDGIMVARGDLGIEIKPEKVPIIQKRIIELSNKYGKPVITATQVLASMVNNPRPTRAEISDAANAIYDHTDAIMLSNETATGSYPLESVRMLAKTISSVENELKKQREIVENEIKNKDIPDVNAACLSACELAVDSGANRIIVYSKDGYTMSQMVKHRVFIHTILITPNKNLIQESSLYWGINRSIYKKFTKKQENKNFANELKKFVKTSKLAKKNDKVVIIYNAKGIGSIATYTL
ncbi:pyruvate kinase [Candidatus Peregrinibacteria bacterium]|jgi:pyruvate kinase|nr:pyruvate kinase [Candidatus Peregrinibacteria bacterium]MBT4148188.1 pyruvate kinase [Candidatus Peregrinibacteria bacterium]MBT4365899.1 pyruvate kinase [Candidatus Peregrinibacteria bacterium]MBT4455662.1 pyruvate kinase [Candidatus Peregrinibacteria bacterium]